MFYKVPSTPNPSVMLEAQCRRCRTGPGQRDPTPAEPHSPCQSSPGSTAGAVPALLAAPHPGPQQPRRLAASAAPPAQAQRLSHLSQAPLPCGGPKAEPLNSAKGTQSPPAPGREPVPQGLGMGSASPGRQHPPALEASAPASPGIK